MHVEDDAGVRTVTFDRPDVLNAFTMETAVELADAIEGADPSPHDAIVLTGEGRAFSAGGDVEAMAEREETPDEAYRRIRDTFGRLAEAALDSPLPIVARINGDAVGAGMAVVALSDFAYAVEEARFGAAFVKVGLVPDTGGTFLLPRLVGLRAAKELVFTGDLVGAERAAELGLINEAVPAEALDETVDELVDTLRARPTATIGLAKGALHDGLGDWRSALDEECRVQTIAYGTPAHEEGVAAFLEGREPTFE